jgi:hypothetical protein
VTTAGPLWVRSRPYACRFERPLRLCGRPKTAGPLSANCGHCHPGLRGGVRCCHRGWCSNVAVSKPSGCCGYCRRGESAASHRPAPSARVGLLDGVSGIQCRSMDKCRCCYTDRHSCWFSARCLEGDTRCLNLDEGGARYEHGNWRERQFAAELPESSSCEQIDVQLATVRGSRMPA